MEPIKITESDRTLVMVGEGVSERIASAYGIPAEFLGVEKEPVIDPAQEPDQSAPTGWQRSPNRKDKRIKIGVFGCAKCGSSGPLRNVGEVKLCERCIEFSGKITVAKMNKTPRKQRREYERTMKKLTKGAK